MIARAPQTFRRRLQCSLARRREWYLRVLRWTGRGSLEKRIYLSLIREGEVVFDLGANLGYFTLLFSDLAGRGGEVHAFEPVPPTFARLRETVERCRRYENIFLNQAACSDVEGRGVIQMPDDDIEQASLQPHQEGSWSQAGRITPFETRTLRLDNYARGRRPGWIHFVKCDVEGAELPALQGMEAKLKCCRPLLLLEVFSKWTAGFGYHPVDLIDFLRRLGYDRFFAANARLIPLVDARATLAEGADRQSMNLLCAVGAWHADRLRALRHL